MLTAGSKRKQRFRIPRWVYHKCSKHGFCVESRAIRHSDFPSLAAKLSILSLKSLLMAVSDLIKIHRLLLRRLADRNDEVSNTYGGTLR
jgi:hypothetical protein